MAGRPIQGGDDLIAVAAEVLSRAFVTRLDVRLAGEQESDNTVYRCHVEPPLPGGETSVIVKRVTNTELNQPGFTGQSHRFLNELASLSFAGQTGASEFVPRIIAADPNRSVMVLQDLGDCPTLEDLLLDNGTGTVKKLVALGPLLGKLQASTVGQESEFIAIQKAGGTASPCSDSTTDQRQRLHEFERCLDDLAIAPATGFWDSLNQIEALIHDDLTFRTFIHADAGPHNVLATQEGLRLIDLEFGVFRNGLCDAVGARLGFPQTTRGYSIPGHLVDAVETGYRKHVTDVMPQAEDDAIFNEALAAACAHWALNRWAGLWRTRVRKRGVARPPRHPDARAQAYTVIRSFISHSCELGLFTPVAETLESVMGALKKMWPDLDVRPIYPGLISR